MISPSSVSPSDAVRRLAEEVARPHASDVDRRARFPVETFAALREAGLLGIAAPRELGGRGAELAELVEHCRLVARACASSGLVLAMHHIQVGCLASHRGRSTELADYLRSVARDQRLIASVTSEVGTWGDLRSSGSACVTPAGGGELELVKQGTTVSYGLEADDLLLTARKHPGAAATDQVLVLAPRGSFVFEPKGVWDPLGMRGTVSPGGEVRARVADWCVLPEPFAEIAAHTMVPWSHLLWAGVWIGIAEDATSIVHGLVRQRARSQPGRVPREATRLARSLSLLDLMRSNIARALEEYARAVREDPSSLGRPTYVRRINAIKITVSELVVEVVTEALRAGGLAAYRNGEESSLGRHLRDAHSAALMVSNDRLRETNAALLLTIKDMP